MIAAQAEAASESFIPVMRPQLPTADKLLPYLQRIDEARYYSNHGGLLRDFERRLSRHFNVAPKQLAVVSNGTTALSAALLAAGAKPGTRCLLPAWTFVASAAAVWAAGLTPHFIDVSVDTWMLDPEVLRRRADLDGVGAVMVVSAFGAPVPTRAWDAFTADTGIPVIIDGAAAFDTVAMIPAARPRRAPVMISLHATKAFGIGEGSLVLSADESLMHRLSQICNFGFGNVPEGQLLGYNGKLSEYHAAVGLAMLDEWETRRQRLSDLTKRYIEGLAAIPGVRMSPSYGSGWISCYCNISVDDRAAMVIDRLKYVGIETRRWWRSGAHVQPAYQAFPRDLVPVSEDLAKRVFGLPFYHDVSEDQVSRVLACLRSALS